MVFARLKRLKVKPGEDGRTELGRTGREDEGRSGAGRGEAGRAEAGRAEAGLAEAGRAEEGLAEEGREPPEEPGLDSHPERAEPGLEPPAEQGRLPALPSSFTTTAVRTAAAIFLWYLQGTGPQSRRGVSGAFPVF